MALLWRQTCHEDLRRARRIKICVCIVLQETARSSWFDKTTNRSRNNSTTCGNKKSKPRGCGREWIRLKDIIIVYCVNTLPCILNSALNILLFTKSRGITYYHFACFSKRHLVQNVIIKKKMGLISVHENKHASGTAIAVRRFGQRFVLTQRQRETRKWHIS